MFTFTNCAIFVQCQSHSGAKGSFSCRQRLPNCSCHEIVLNSFAPCIIHATPISHISNCEKHFHKNSSKKADWKSFFSCSKSSLFNFIRYNSVECPDLLVSPLLLRSRSSQLDDLVCLATVQEIFLRSTRRQHAIMLSLLSVCRLSLRVIRGGKGGIL
jgi:hypothetical protein